MFFTHFIIGLIVSSFTVIMVLLTRKVFHNQLSSKWRYHLWFLLFMALSLPFLPNSVLHVGSQIVSLDMNQSDKIMTSTSSMEQTEIKTGDWMQDFSLSVNKNNPELLNNLLMYFWVIGVLVLIIVNVHAWMKMNRIKHSTSETRNEELLSLFHQCKQELHVKKELVLGESQLVQSPTTFGLIRTYIVLPNHSKEWLSKEEIKYIFLHELHHYKSRDVLSNYAIVLFQILYWFNPLVWFAFREMRLDREIACDTAVLHHLDESSRVKYGNTIIHFLDRTKSRYLPLTNHFFGSKVQIKKRVEKIASFTKESKVLRFKSAVIFLLVGLIVVSQIPLVSVFAADDERYYFHGKHTAYEDLSPYFEDYEGSFVLFDMKNDQYHIYNKDKSTRRVSPNSTYKIYSALLALESNVISRNDSSLKWNGIEYPYDAWNQDQNLYTAMSHSVNWYFQHIDKKVQLDSIYENLKEIGYGNLDVSGGVEQFWMESSLKISPIEQVQLLTSFYKNKWGFKDQNVETVKDAILLEEKGSTRLSGKTGTGRVNERNVNGWFIGYVEDVDNTYVFATNIQNGRNASGSIAADITLSILNAKGIY
ncbi:BlaR1 family beta-lactam sensor/signal transducer [Radiobacillus deserti]|uniref:BlaR1 family beta-lactam sensor/signal transducer n=1 Tax=Radiobacillus deserti TaxID=2594883 RepID=A0A516KC66_9BACI|nr:BlaR1 family beta-lactam sensor/signal transducer [Radiobacillus deserti]QDP38957.1 BlaR1 family beta-lactam sensor/signal transducer [Radiobacillus deserti]